MLLQQKDYRILIADDEPSIALLISEILEDEGYDVKSAADGEEALRAAIQFNPHLLVVDLKMPKMDGLTFIENYRQISRSVQFIILTAYATVETAVKAMRMGAFDYLLKPLKEPNELRHTINRAFEMMRDDLSRSDEAVKSDDSLINANTSSYKSLPQSEMIYLGSSALKEDIEAVAETDATVLITGETGTGKTVLARHIHRISQRTGALIEVNCAAVPDSLIESELFGYEKGAFTGAVQTRKGKFEAASNGTILLDEITEISLSAQSKLLRVLQDGSFERLGSNKPIISKARVICATNKDLKHEVQERRFREDLYYRINVFPIEIPPLRNRKDVLPSLINYLVEKISTKHGKDIKPISEDVLSRLLSHVWPGNIRELENTLERAVILSKDGRISIDRAIIFTDIESSSGSLREMERKTIKDALIKTNGNRKKTAALLGISLRSLQYKIKEFRLE
ncbi:two component, sigma54 specific, transcriptional regulator, Fis family [Candidatus Magnetoovum chiemensis]|nr:two component, sigma54 specific, transcriptional regulator, Fis family [Candidatus Magnetoovum chiemensis]